MMCEKQFYDLLEDEIEASNVVLSIYDEEANDYSIDIENEYLARLLELKAFIDRQH